MDSISTVSKFNGSSLAKFVFFFEMCRNEGKRDGFSAKIEFLKSNKMCILIKCFIRCYLDQMGVFKDHILDRERAMDLELARNEDILDDCSKESRGNMQQLFDVCKK